MSSRRAWLVTFTFATLPLLGWWLTGLLDLDEGFYGAAAAEMNRRGEWITPFFNGKPFFEKPILIYWLAKPSLAVFGDMIGPRLPSVLATLALFGIVAWFGERHLGRRKGLVATLIMASSLLVVAAGRMLLTDPLLNVCLCGALFTFWESLVGDRRWRLVSAALLGFSTLAKGPVGLALFAVIAGITYWRERDLRSAFRGWWLVGTIILLAVVASWYLPAYRENGQLFVREFLIKQNVQRFQGGDAAHKTPGLYRFVFFVPILLVGMFPWSLALWKAWIKRDKPADGVELVRRYLALWAAVIFIFFSISGTQLPHYILPCFAPLALLVADRLMRLRIWTENTKFALAGWAVAMSVLVNVGFSVYYQRSGHAEVQALAKWVKGRPGMPVVYQMPRRNKDLGTGKLKLLETSHPSLVMYLDQVVSEPDNIGQLLAIPGDLWVITRPDRLGARDVSEADAKGRKLTQVATPVEEQNYRLYHLTAGPSVR
jgi:4-amino-4-deoxy-L-arabinose transferase-like glycosyltransferase